MEDLSSQAVMQLVNKFAHMDVRSLMLVVNGYVVLVVSHQMA